MKLTYILLKLTVPRDDLHIYSQLVFEKSTLDKQYTKTSGTGKLYIFIQRENKSILEAFHFLYTKVNSN